MSAAVATPRGRSTGAPSARSVRRGRRALGGLAVLGALVLAVAGCTPTTAPEPGAAPTIEVAGDFGIRPTITIPDGFTVGETSTATLVTGDGPVLVDGQSVLADYLAENVTTGEVVADTYEGLPEIRTFSVDDLGQPLYDLLEGATIGSRLLRVELGTDADPNPHVLVLDLLPLRAQGEPLEPLPAMPTVTLADDGAPTVAIPDAAPPVSVTSTVLIKGAGPQVTLGQSVVLQLVAVRWSDGAVADSTWGVAPRAVALADLPTGLLAGLVEQTVGSQVLVVVPPADGNGQDTLVYVADILATGDVAVGPSGTEGQPGGDPTAGATDAPTG
ncbi:FKBP-type peptidyl-prolyl cis-trans isomerase [Miniimonas sp. S16]|uniref:FKBP-type peptidyl-prolyl cis-trans isomerase n=1 Tax=Miniimonas sp. S16 TaxID=2171623 RepID=UPI000D525D0D|nr:peptidylprolyl isomerase [Miniimonas sp. S16]